VPQLIAVSVLLFAGFCAAAWQLAFSLVSAGILLPECAAAGGNTC